MYVDRSFQGWGPVVHNKPLKEGGNKPSMIKMMAQFEKTHLYQLTNLKKRCVTGNSLRMLVLGATKKQKWWCNLFIFPLHEQKEFCLSDRRIAIIAVFCPKTCAMTFNNLKSLRHDAEKKLPKNLVHDDLTIGATRGRVTSNFYPIPGSFSYNMFVLYVCKPYHFVPVTNSCCMSS